MVQAVDNECSEIKSQKNIEKMLKNMIGDLSKDKNVCGISVNIRHKRGTESALFIRFKGKNMDGLIEHYDD